MPPPARRLHRQAGEPNDPTSPHDPGGVRRLCERPVEASVEGAHRPRCQWLRRELHHDLRRERHAGDRPAIHSITGGVQGDGPGNSFVFIPSLKAVIAGDTVFDHVYFGVPKDKAKEDWMKTLDQIQALKPAILIPGHEGPGAKHDLSAIAWMKKYIADWYKNVAASKNAAEMKAKVLKQYPGLGMEFTLNDRVAAFFPDQNKAK